MRRVMLLVTAIGVALLLASGAVMAAPIGMLKQYKVTMLSADKIATLQLR